MLYAMLGAILVGEGGQSEYEEKRKGRQDTERNRKGKH